MDSGLTDDVGPVGLNTNASAVALPNSGGGHAVSGRDMMRKELGNLSYNDKAFEYQYLKNVTVGVGTAPNTAFVKLKAGDLLTPYMKTLWTLNNYANVQIEVKFIAAANVGLTGTFMAGTCQSTIENPDQNTLSDNDRIIRQLTSMSPFEMELSPITNGDNGNMPWEFSSLNLPLTDINTWFPQIVLISTSTFASTFANDALKFEIAVWSRFSKSSRFKQVGIPKTITAGESSASFANPNRLEFDKVFAVDNLDSLKFVGDGNYGHPYTRPDNTLKQVYRPTKVVSFSTYVRSNPNGTDRAISLEYTKELEDTYEWIPRDEGLDPLSLSATCITQTVGTAVISIESGAVQISDLNPTQVKLSSPSVVRSTGEVSETLVLPALPVSINNFDEGGFIVADDVADKFSVNERPVVSVGTDVVTMFKDVWKTLQGKTGSVTLDWSQSNKIRGLTEVVQGSSVIPARVPTTVAAYASQEKLPPKSGHDWASIRGLGFIEVEFNVDVGTLLSQSGGLVGARASDMTQLPVNCTLLQVSGRNQFPTVPAAVADQSLPTIIPELDLAKSLSRFYDPTRTFDLGIYDKKFKQLVFNIIYSGPNKCVFIKSSSPKSSYFLLNYPVSDLYIGSCADITSQTFIPNSLVSVPVVDRTNASAMQRLNLGTRAFLHGSLQQEGASFSSILGGASNVGSSLADLIKVFEDGSVENQQQSEEALEEKLQSLIGKQKMEQLKEMFNQQKEMAEIESSRDLTTSGLANPAVQRSAAMSSVVPNSVIPNPEHTGKETSGVESETPGDLASERRDSVTSQASSIAPGWGIGHVPDLPPRYSQLNPAISGLAQSGESSTDERPVTSAWGFGGSTQRRPGLTVIDDDAPGAPMRSTYAPTSIKI